MVAHASLLLACVGDISTLLRMLFDRGHAAFSRTSYVSVGLTLACCFRAAITVRCHELVPQSLP
jgi:hypothetical protein